MLSRRHCLQAGLLTLGVPAYAQAAPPRPLKPGLATAAAWDADGQLWLAGHDRQGRLRLLRAPWSSGDPSPALDDGALLDTGGDAVAAEGESVPRLLLAPAPHAGVVLVAYVRPGERPFTGDVRLLRSTDGGQRFAPPVTVHQNQEPITHRFPAMAFDAQGHLHTVWIDKRDREAALARGAPYRGAAIYRNLSFDAGASFGPDQKLADHTCECCRIALVAKPDGGMATLWRHVFEPNERDHAFAVLDGAHAQPATRATWDRWALDACPHHGPGLAAATDGGFHACWFGQREGVMGVRWGRLDAQGHPLGATRRLPEAEHADLISAGAQVALVWRHFDGQHTRLRALVSADDGRHWQPLELARSPQPNDHPRLLRQGQQLWVVWRDRERLHIHRLEA